MNKFFNFLQFSEPWDQKIAKILAKPFIFFNIHPNLVTLIGIILGLFTFYFYSKGDQFFAKVGSIVFFFGACFDHIDGEVARKLNKTSVLGHYLDHLGVCITYIALFIGLGVWCQKNAGNGYYYGVVAGLCIFLIMTIRFYLERIKGGEAIRQTNILGFEHEDIIYIVIPITFFNKIDDFLYYSYIGTLIFLVITLLIFLYKMKKL